MLSQLKGLFYRVAGRHADAEHITVAHLIRGSLVIVFVVLFLVA